MKIIKFLLWILFIGLLFGTAYYFNVLTTLKDQVKVVNLKFLAYLPVEYRILVGFCMFAGIFIFIENQRK